MKRTFPILVFLVLAAMGGPLAQEAEENAEKEPPAAEEQDAGEAAAESDASDEVFVPSERISADQEVTFPVDI
jgi:hypothetical protein